MIFLVEEIYTTVEQRSVYLMLEVKENRPTKEIIMDQATILFTNKGYTGTSVRDIAMKSGVNISLISYYFGGKKGLLEALMVDFLEGYLKELESVQQKNHADAFEKLMDIVSASLTFMQQHHLRARFVLREMTLDSTLVREITSTYLMKEKHIYETILKQGIDEGTFPPLPMNWTIMQIRGIITMPFLHHQYVREVFQLHPHHSHFVVAYQKELYMWLMKTLLPS